MPHRVLMLASLALAILMAGCSRPTSVDVTRHVENPDEPRSRILVIGLSSNLNRRDRWETVMADTLRRSGMTAWASTSLMDSDVDISRETIAPLVEQTGAQLALVTRLVDQEVHATDVEARTGVKTRRKDETPVVDFFRYDYTEYEEPAYVLVTSTVRLTTDVFETEEGRLIYTLDTTTYDKDSEFELLVEVTEAIERRLRRERLIAAPD